MTKSALFAAAAALAVATAAGAQDASVLSSGTYNIDDSHTVVTFQISHLGLAPYTAQLETVTGALTLDTDTPENTSLTATIATGSVDTDFTGEKDFDAEVEGFLKAEEFPEITFTSTAFEKTGDTTGVLTGDLAFFGATKPVTLDVTLTGATEAHPFAGAPALGVVATGAIKRSDFGVLAETPLDGALGDDVTIQVTAELIKAS